MICFDETDKNLSSSSPSRTVLHSLATAVEAEYRAWKTEQWINKNEQISATEGVIQSLEACTRFALSVEDGQRLSDLLSHWYAELDTLCQEVDLYSPNPKIDDTAVQREWLDTQRETLAK